MSDPQEIQITVTYDGDRLSDETLNAVSDEVEGLLCLNSEQVDGDSLEITVSQTDPSDD